MRTSSFVILFFAFVVGWISAKFIGQYVFVSADTPQVVIIDKGPRTKILVAKTAIPVGLEIMAEHVSFVDVPFAELPARAITSFKDVYRRRPAFPIPVNCPICEDLLIAKDDEQDMDNVAKFIPAGYKIISLDVNWRSKRTPLIAEKQIDANQTDFLLVKKNTESENVEAGQFLKKGSRVDVRVIARRIPKGNLASIKEQVLQAYADKFDLDSVSELVLENVQIHNLTNYGYDSKGNNIQKISFMLEESKIEQLTNAAKKGRLRIVAHQPSEPTQLDNTTTTETNVTQTTPYKGIKSYGKKSETIPKKTAITNTTNEESTAENSSAVVESIVKPEIAQTSTSPSTPQKIKPTVTTTPTIDNNKEKTSNTTTIALQTPITSQSAKTESVAAASSFWVLPFYLRGLFDYQLPQNTTANNATTAINPLQEIKICSNNFEQEITGSANSHKLKTDSIPDNKTQTSIPATNHNLVFTKPEIKENPQKNIVPISVTENPKNYSEQILQADAAGCSSTSKYMLGSSNTNNKNIP
ncbi:MAG: hypothetical protein LBC74_00545 [Planctomycetaceae bacterium]|nr:hypothetical protein [Planctomycetaceae bacterium]